MKDEAPPTPRVSTSANFLDVHESVTLSANSSTASSDIVEYYWDFGDGSNATGEEVTHSFSSGGDYNVLLIVTDVDGNKAMTSSSVYVNEPPRPVINVQTPIKVGSATPISGSASIDVDGSIASYIWNVSGYAYQGKTITHTFKEVGDFLIGLTVTDDSGTRNSTSLMVVVQLCTFDVIWKEKEEFIRYPTSSNSMENLEEGENTTINQDIDTRNLTKVVIMLLWQDDIPRVQPGNDEFEMIVLTPYGMESSKRSRTENITIIESGLNRKPNDMTLQGNDEGEILRQLPPAKTTGIGEWEMKVILHETPGIIDADTGLPKVDNGNDWHLSITLYYYEPKIIEK